VVVGPDPLDRTLTCLVTFPRGVVELGPYSVSSWVLTVVGNPLTPVVDAPAVFPQVGLVELFRREIEKLPRKTLVYWEPEKKKILMPNQVRSRLGDNFRLLGQAIEETLQKNIHPGQIPFVITSTFEKNIEKPRMPADSVQIDNERIE